jgi:hypothetical protein
MIPLPVRNFEAPAAAKIMLVGNGLRIPVSVLQRAHRRMSAKTA